MDLTNGPGESNELPPKPDPDGELTSMPSWSECTSPPSPPPAWTATRAQATLADAVCQLLAVVDLLEQVYAGLPPPADIDDRQEGRKPYDLPTDILATIECVLEDDLRPAIESLHRSATTTDERLAREYREWLQRRLA